VHTVVTTVYHLGWVELHFLEFSCFQLKVHHWKDAYEMWKVDRRQELF
jgi:hypothetical protein